MQALEEPDLQFAHPSGSEATSSWAWWLSLWCRLCLWGLRGFIKTMITCRLNLQPRPTKICGVLRCSVELLKHVASVAIDSVAFTTLGPGSHRLSFVVKTTEPLMLAVSSVELTLTDVRDQGVVRSVFSPHALAGRFDHLATASEWPMTVNLGVAQEVSPSAVVGYRSLALCH